MNEDFVPFELAVKLKEKGFKEKCIAYYWEKINEHTPSFLVEDNMPEDGLNLLDLLSNHNQAEWSQFIDAPTISQVLKWLREEKGMEVYINYNRVYKHWIYIARAFDDSCYNSVGGFKSYEQAAIAGIEYVLDNLI